jgi:RecA-family ATPase
MPIESRTTLWDRVEAAPIMEPEPPQRFPVADLKEWATQIPQPKRFVMPGFIPADEVTLLTGAGGSNKSTFGQQLATCCAIGLPMLGVGVSQMPTFYITAEDDEDRLHWMQAHICTAIGADMAALSGKLHLASLRGRLGNELATFDGNGRMSPAPAFVQLEATIAVTVARLVVLDNVAHLFVGNENDRAHVTAFVNLLYSLCLKHGVTVVLIAHPNKAGDTYSGSTAWLNAVRSQIVISRRDDGTDPDARILRLGKANYARQGDELRFRWHDFALKLDSDLSPDLLKKIAATAQATTDNEIFLGCLRERECQGDGRHVGPSPGPNYAPAQFEGTAMAKGLGRARLRAAMDRLFTIGAIETATVHNKAKARSVTIIREATRCSPNSAPNPFPD